MSDVDPLLDRLMADTDATDRVLEDQALHAVKQALLGVSSPAPTARLGRYELDRRLGRGSAGTVYVARDPELGRDVAIKLLQPTNDSDAQRDRMMHEARALALLSHPNIVVVHDVGCVEDRDASVARPGSVFIVMELLEGTTLEQWRRARPRTSSAVLGAFIDAGRGLAAAHRAGVLHRDFKAHNVMVTAEDKVKVVDFGLARGLHAAPRSLEGHREPTARSLREVTSVAGTPLYMAPELAEGAVADPRSDQYSYAVSLWRALTDEDPFPSVDWTRLQAAKRRGPPRSDARLPRRLAPVLQRAMAPDPEERYPSMEPLLDALARHTTRRRWVAGAASGLTIIAVIALGWAASDPASDPACEAPRPLWTEAEQHQAHGMFTHSGVADAEARLVRADATLTWADAALGEVGSRSCGHPGITTCVGELHAHHAAVVDALLKADPRVVDQSDALLEDLGDPHDCERTTAPVVPVDRAELDALVAHRLDPSASGIAQARQRAESWAEREQWSLAAQWQRLACRLGAPRTEELRGHCLRLSELARRSGRSGLLAAAWLRHAEVLHEHGHLAQARLLLELATPQLESASPALARAAARLRGPLDSSEPRR